MSSAASSTDVLPGRIRFCPICCKPFTSASTLERHLSYCRRSHNRPKIRARSCWECYQAKSKCSFERRCSRCVAKKLNCTYERSLAAIPSTTEAALDAPNDTEQCQNLSNGQRPWTPNTPQAGDITDQDDHLVLDSAQTSSQGDNAILSSTFSESFSILDDSFFTSLALPSSSESTTSCSGASINTEFLQPLELNYPLAQQSATLLWRGLRAFPEKMLSRENFPPFIHPLLHCSTLPEPLAVCMRIAAIFNSRTADIRPFLWRIIESEQKRFLEEAYRFSESDLLAAMQAHLIYIIMCVVGEAKHSQNWNQMMLLTFEILCNQLKKSQLDPFYRDERSHPSLSWHEWIVAESQRRIACVWFLMSRIVAVKSHSHYCSITDNFRMLALPSPKTQWEARSETAWAQAMEAGHPNVSTIGHLLDAHRAPTNLEDTERLDYWYARVDNLGMLLSIAMAIT
ncbi:hypothetical protein V8C35DRAFT_311967 [Trichoderma chlorosporum]